MTDRIIPENIVILKPNEVFVFGSNLAGRHGKGAAKTSLQWGSRYGVGEGICGQTYAIPTKDENLRVLPLTEIQKHVDQFIKFAFNNQQLTFMVTAIGTGLAGYSPSQIAPMFEPVKDFHNVYLPKEFI